jgi:hypothetical protein
MIIKFRIISGETEDFVRDIEIPSDSSFLDLHLSIQAACDFDDSMMASFYLSDANWDKGQEIVLQIIDETEQKNTLLMDDVEINQIIKAKGNRLIYMYDFFSIRFFFIEVVNIRKKLPSDEDLEFPICTLCKGISPRQILIDDLSDLNFEDDIREEFNDFEDMGFENIDDYDL